jgi:hypothetical protein
MKQYLLTMYQPEGGVPSKEVLEGVMREVGAIRRDMKAAGAWIYSGGLHPPSSATAVHFRGGEVVTTDGPFAEAKEYIGGLTILQATDLDAALNWARKLSKATTLPIEVRPFREGSGS